MNSSQYVEQLEAHMDEGGTVTNANVRDLIQMTMNKDQFHNLLRILINLDHYLVEEVISEEEWPKFRDNPWQWFISAAPHKSDFVWGRMMERLNGRLS
jgi:hypothetical protein